MAMAARVWGIQETVMWSHGNTRWYDVCALTPWWLTRNPSSGWRSRVRSTTLVGRNDKPPSPPLIAMLSHFCPPQSRTRNVSVVESVVGGEAVARRRRDAATDEACG